MGYLASATSMAAIVMGTLLTARNRSAEWVMLLLLILLVLLASTLVAACWRLKVLSSLHDHAWGSDPDQSFYRATETACSWLRPVRPSFSNGPSSVNFGLKERIARGCTSSLVIATSLISMAGIYFVLSGGVSERGLFGQILQFSGGRAIIGGFCTYTAIGSVALVFLGLSLDFKGRGE